MDQITRMLDESNKRMEKIISGSYDDRQIDQGRLELLAQVKVVNSLISTYVNDAKTAGTLVKIMKKKNIIDERTALSMGSYRTVDMVNCDLSEKVISRHECLDLSGDPPEGTDCSGCEHFATTRHMLVDGNE